MAKSQYQTLVSRVVALERAVFGVDAKREARERSQDRVGEKFTGATGGLRLIISKGFFDRRRRFSEIEAELNKQGYHYSKQAIQTPLNRLSLQSGPLVSLREQGRKVYVKRK